MLPRPTFALAAVCLLVSGHASHAQEDAERELEQVRDEIEAVTETLASRRSSRDAASRELESIERELANTTRRLAELDERVAELEQRERELAAQMREARGRLEDERGALAEQVRMSYMTGRQELFKLLLNQDSPATLGRMLVYYEYLNRARSSRIEAVDEDLAELERLAADSAEVRQRLAAVRAETESERQRLERQRGERAAVLERVEEQIDSAGDRLAALEREEQRLADLVERLGEATAEFPVDVDEPFGELKGTLAWPAPGTLANDFGAPRNGGPMRWNGVVLDSPAGTRVRAIYTGRVAYSDWLPGLGLLVVVDHGDGYMSLYGHNQAVYTEAGDWVEPGEAIAEVGDTGGQQNPSLYFEIRRAGQPVNPREWVADAPTPP